MPVYHSVMMPVYHSVMMPGPEDEDCRVNIRRVGPLSRQQQEWQTRAPSLQSYPMCWDACIVSSSDLCFNMCTYTSSGSTVDPKFDFVFCTAIRKELLHDFFRHAQCTWSGCWVHPWKRGQLRCYGWRRAHITSWMWRCCVHHYKPM